MANTTAAAAVPLSGPPGEWPSPEGLFAGYMGVVYGQVAILAYYALMRYVVRPPYVQVKGPPPSTLGADLLAHVTNPESFLMTGGYLAVVWMFRILPDTYYDLEADWTVAHVLGQLVTVDFFTFVAHVAEHKVSTKLYAVSHKPHHRYVSPRLYNAFSGSPLDTFCMIVIPLVLTSQLWHVSCASFKVFGAAYSMWFTLIHSERDHPWEGRVWRALGLGAAADHHVHHALFVFQYAHFFTWFDWFFGTYREPNTVSTFRAYHDYLAAHPDRAAEHEERSRRAAGLKPKKAS